MNPEQKIRRNPLILLTIACVLLSVSLLPGGFPVFIFFALVPLFILLDLPWKPIYIHAILLLATVAACCMAFVEGPWGIAGVFFYVLLVIALLTAYVSAQRLTQNRLNKFSLIILWTGMEYLLVKLLIHKNPSFLADVFNESSTWVRWNIYTGYLSVSLWILMINLMIYQALLKNSKADYFLLSLAVLTIIVPIIYSLSLTHSAVGKADVIRFYSGNNDVNTYYVTHGELISRTGAWVSILIIIFTLIRVKIKKVAR
jgi:hypothetical protein